MRQATAVLTAALLIAAGACLLDGDHGSRDLCLAHAAVTAMAVPGILLAPAGVPVPVAALAAPLLRLELPSPPPRG
jgi:hypothetical protein